MRKTVRSRGTDHTVATYPRQNRMVLATGVLACLCFHLLLIVAICKNTLFVTTHPKQEKNNRMEIVLIADAASVATKIVNKAAPVVPQAPKEITAPRRTKRQTQAAPRQMVRTAPPGKPSNNVSSSEKHLDLDAIRNDIGRIVAEVDKEDNDTPVAQLRHKPLYENDEDNRIARAIRSTTRPDCRDSIANTGLLAPLVILSMALDKKDSGCKW